MRFAKASLIFWIVIFVSPILHAEVPSKAANAQNTLSSWLNTASKPMTFDDGKVQMKIGAESRYRFEYRNNFNLNDASYEDDALNLFRNRLNFDLNLKPQKLPPVRIFSEGQEAHSFAESSLDKTNAFANEFDLRQLFVEIPNPSKKIPVSIKAGRQELAYGEERFVGAFNWSNVSRVFDAVKIVYTPSPWFQLDTFFSEVVAVRKDRPDATAHHDHFYGIYSTLKPFKEHTLDTFLFIRHDRDEGFRGERPGEFGPLKEYTIGNRFKGKVWSFDYGTEYAVQFGSRAHDDIAAWAFHQEAGYTLTRIFATPRLYAEYNHASGDRNPSDGAFNTFDNLFPTNHDKYGFMDFLSLKNMNDIRLGTSIKPHPKLTFISDFHWFFLDAKESAWFAANQATFRAPNPNADTQLGEELDLVGNLKLNERFSFLVGYSHFFAGPFAKDTGAHDDANFFYTQILSKL